MRQWDEWNETPDWAHCECVRACREGYMPWAENLGRELERAKQARFNEYRLKMDYRGGSNNPGPPLRWERIEIERQCEQAWREFRKTA